MWQLLWPCNFSIILWSDPNCAITAQSKWPDIVKYLGPASGPPIMYRSSHGKIQNVNDDDGGGGDGKEQSIRIYAFQSVLFEIMGNDCISTVTLFRESSFAAKRSGRGRSSPAMGAQAERVAVFGDPIPIERVQSIYGLPAPPSPQHVARINPSPLSKSIEEAARSQLQFKGTGPEEKYSKKSHKKRKKRKRSGGRSKSGSALPHSAENAVVEIDAEQKEETLVATECQRDDPVMYRQGNEPAGDRGDGMSPGNETFDNILL